MCIWLYFWCGYCNTYINIVSVNYFIIFNDFKIKNFYKNRMNNHKILNKIPAFTIG